MTRECRPPRAMLLGIATIALALASCGGEEGPTGAGGSPSGSTQASATGAAGRHPPGCLDAELFFEPSWEQLVMASCVDQMDLASVEQLWTWDGTAWQQVDSDGPAAMVVTGVAFDGARRALVRYGGLPMDGNDCTDETWEWDESGWAQVDAVAPPPCDHMKLVFDAARSVTLLFGGQDAAGTTSADTWTWNGVAWQRVAIDGPSFRAHFELVYDDAHEQVLLWGGFDGNRVFDDFWSWDGAEWTELSFPGPSARSHASMAVVSDGLLLFGGATSASTYASLSDETWLLTDGRWSLQEGAGPSPRGMAAIAYDPGRDVTVLYGGFDADAVALADTWEWDGEWRCVDGC